MKLYHGSNIEIDKINFDKCQPYKDFGKGFYLTTMPEQAIKMAKRVSRIYGGDPCITVFDFDEKGLEDTMLSKKIFPRATKE